MNETVEVSTVEV